MRYDHISDMQCSSESHKTWQGRLLSSSLHSDLKGRKSLISLKYDVEVRRPLRVGAGPLCRADREAVGEGEESVRRECEGLPLGTVSTNPPF